MPDLAHLRAANTTAMHMPSMLFISFVGAAWGAGAVAGLAWNEALALALAVPLAFAVLIAACAALALRNDPLFA